MWRSERLGGARSPGGASLAAHFQLHSDSCRQLIWMHMHVHCIATCLPYYCSIRPSPPTPPPSWVLMHFLLYLTISPPSIKPLLLPYCLGNNMAAATCRPQRVTPKHFL